VKRIFLGKISWWCKKQTLKWKGAPVAWFLVVQFAAKQGHVSREKENKIISREGFDFLAQHQPSWSRLSCFLENSTFFYVWAISDLAAKLPFPSFARVNLARDGIIVLQSWVKLGTEHFWWNSCFFPLCLDFNLSFSKVIFPKIQLNRLHWNCEEKKNDSFKAYCLFITALQQLGSHLWVTHWWGTFLSTMWLLFSCNKSHLWVVKRTLSPKIYILYILGEFLPYTTVKTSAGKELCAAVHGLSVGVFSSAYQQANGNSPTDEVTEACMTGYTSWLARHLHF
jgi:hypothetical protein